MRFTTIAVLLLSSLFLSAVNGKPGNNGGGNPNKGPGNNNGKSAVHASPEVAAKIEALEAKVSPGQEKKAEDAAGGDKENNGNAYAYGQENKEKKAKDAADGDKENNGNAYAYGQEKKDDTDTIKGKEMAELKKIEKEVKEVKDLEEKELNQGQAKKNLRAATPPP
jgi:hypothetical protein